MDDSYQRPWFLGNGHAQTIWPHLFRALPQLEYERDFAPTTDGQQLAVDWLRKPENKRVAVISHGLEGHSQRKYVVGMAQLLFASGWDVACWNYRWCGGLDQAVLKFTHSGSTDDLDAVVRHVLNTKNYDQVDLLGFSMGGNLSLLYLGREAASVPPEVKHAVVFSAPCDLKSSNDVLELPGNRIYMKRFLVSLREKMERLDQLFPGKMNLSNYSEIKSFRSFDERFTAPLHGFSSAQEYWSQSSSKPWIPNVRVPTWIISARNDPFLGADCYPSQETPKVKIVSTQHGGHCSWPGPGNKPCWHENVALNLLS